LTPSRRSNWRDSERNLIDKTGAVELLPDDPRRELGATAEGAPLPPQEGECKKSRHRKRTLASESTALSYETDLRNQFFVFHATPPPWHSGGSLPPSTIRLFSRCALCVRGRRRA